MVGTEIQPTATYPGVVPVVEGWKAIGEAIGKSRWTVRRWATRRLDPIPVMRLGKTVYCTLSALEAWLQLNRRVLD